MTQDEVAVGIRPHAVLSETERTFRKRFATAASERRDSPMNTILSMSSNRSAVQARKPDPVPLIDLTEQFAAIQGEIFECMYNSKILFRLLWATIIDVVTDACCGSIRQV